MKEQKYLAWDSLSKTWLFPYPNGFSLFSECTAFNLIEQSWCEKNKDYCKTNRSLDFLKYVKIVEFIGAKDVNGNDLYDGHIIHESGSYIVWSEHLLCWCFQFKNSMLQPTPLFHDMEYFKTIEIKGHIFDYE